MKRSELIKHLRHHGCELHREGGKHSVFINPAQRKASTVPRHREIIDVLVIKICKDLGVPSP